jgi:hypothetical protein
MTAGRPVLQRLTRTLLLLALLGVLYSPAQAQDGIGQLEHIIIVWLKDPGNVQQRTRIIEASQVLTGIPGVLSLKSGSVVKSERAIVDSSFDVALIVSFPDQAALDHYLVHPTHVKLVEETLKPLVARIQVYDFH